MSALQHRNDYMLRPESASMAVSYDSGGLLDSSSNKHKLRTSESSLSRSSSEGRSLENSLNDNRAALKFITSIYGVSHIDPELRSQLFFQIDWLLNSEHWEEGDNFADEASFKTLIRFILNSGLLQPPSLGLSDGGNLLASWINGDDRLVLECLPNDRFKWLVSCVYDGEKERVAGESPSLLRLLNSLEPYKNAGWLKP